MVPVLCPTTSSNSKIGFGNVRFSVSLVLEKRSSLEKRENMHKSKTKFPLELTVGV